MRSAMIGHVLAAAEAQPTFVSQYGPLIAALIALIGVLVTLTVNVKRDQARYRSQREDDYRRDQRSAIAAVAVGVHNLCTECELLADLDNLSHWRQRRDSVYAAKTGLLNELTVAGLLIYNPTLQGALDDVLLAWEAVSNALDEIENACLNPNGAGRAAFDHLEEVLPQLGAAADVLHTTTLGQLMPSVVSARR